MRPFALCDAHAHPGSEEELLEREEQQIFTLLCASTLPEAENIFRRVKKEAGRAFAPSSPTLIPTAGLHPWHAADYSVRDMIPFLSECPVIGEIGMDSVWCDTPMDIQEQVFREQLALAHDWGKPVILHTKGREKEIASILSDYPNTYLVHWYSCEQYLESYLELDCYFSIGPDVWRNPAVRRVAEAVPLNRLLIETDGMNAVKWAYSMDSSDRTPPASVASSLLCTLSETAKIRRLPTEDAGIQIYHNFVHGFLKEYLLPGT